MALQQDERGDLCEIWTEDRDPLGAPVPHIYMASLLPGKVRGWVMHERQHDRIFVQMGRLRVALYDARPGSPTERQLDLITLGERNRGLVVVPPGVWHGVQNVGVGEAVFINLPSRAYDYEHPDKQRLPPVNDLIPFAFDGAAGW